MSEILSSFDSDASRTEDALVETADEQQRGSLNGCVLITGHARVDAREALQHTLAAGGHTLLDGVTDAELILHAHEAWGEQCLDHLQGDFSFAIADPAKRRLLCARDHFGVQPFYYARVGERLFFGNRLECVRQHQEVSGRLNEHALGDFLAFGFKQDHSATAFADIHSLPPAHSLVFEGGQLRVQRYWSLPVEPVRFRRPEEYRERYLELLQAAVADRLRTPRAAILLSGGIDSPSIAAIAKARLTPCPAAARGNPPFFKAYTVVYDRLIDHDERRWAGAVADHLGIPIEFLPADDTRLYEMWAEGDCASNAEGSRNETTVGNPGRLPCGRPCTTPEPVDNPLWAIPARLFRRIASDGYQVVLSGEAGDAVSLPERALPGLLATGHFAALARDICGYWRGHGQRPPFWVRAWWNTSEKGGSRRRRLLDVPDWLHPRVAADVVERARDRPPAPGGGWAHRELQSPMWPWCALTQSREWTGVPLDVRYPFLDLRLVSFMLGVPSVPWMHDKELMRLAMRGRLPGEVLRRPKVPLREDPVEALVRRHGPPALPAASNPVWAFVDRARFEERWRAGEGLRQLLRVVSLARWLDGQGARA